MIKLEKQDKLTINDKVFYTDNPKQCIWDNVFACVGIKCEGEFLDEFLLEIKSELEIMKKFQDSLIGNDNQEFANELINKVLNDGTNSKHLSAWVLLMNCGLAVKRDTYPSLLTENGSDLLNILNTLYEGDE